MTDTGANGLLRTLPAMEDALNADWAAGYVAALGRERVKTIIARALDEARRDIRAGVPAEGPPAARVEARAKALLGEKAAGTLKSVVNATGVVLHTNLGRAPLAGAAVRAAAAVAQTYSTLEYDVERGARAGRNAHVEELLCFITGAEAALVVNNNAAAVLLALAATAAGREVIVSCGELVEIGDSFRIPQILAFSGAKLVTAGCTNATYKEDYRRAVTDRTAALLKVHPSNYRIEGFVASASREELAALAAERGIAFIEDLGSGLLCPPGPAFAEREHSVRRCLEAGSGVVTFSGDKLLGGPQIGVVAGSKALVGAMRSHQLLRAVRVDKMTLAAFEATLRLYASGREDEIPAVGMLKAEKNALLAKARRLRRLLRRTAREAGVACDFSVVETADAAGGGALPTGILPGYGVALRSAALPAERLALALRTARVPVIPAIRDGQVVLHVRTLLDGDERRIAGALRPLPKREL